MLLRTAAYWDAGNNTSLIYLGTPVGTSVLRVNATDPDAGHSLRYSILAYTIQAQNQQGALVGSVFPYDFRVSIQPDLC